MVNTGEVIMTDRMKETIDLPSKGWFYAEGNPLAAGQIELYYMTAKEEDILTSKNLIQKGVVLDRLMESLIVDKTIKYGDLLGGDKTAIMIASRILGYGKNYDVKIECPNCQKKTVVSVDLESFPDKTVPFNPEQKGRNEFTTTLPVSKKVISFKLLTHADEKNIQTELNRMEEIAAPGATSSEVTTRMRYCILSIDGSTDRAEIAKFIETMSSKDSLAFREFANSVNPDIDMTFDFACPKCEFTDRLGVPINLNFFYPDFRV